MNTKEATRQFLRLISRLGLQFCMWSMKAVPERWVYQFAHCISRIVYVLAVRHRRIAVESLTIAFGKEKSQKEIRAIAVECFEVMAKNALEFMLFTKKPELITRFITIEGIPHLEKALEKGKGVIALSAHYGNFPLMLSKLARDGYKVDVIMRYMRDPWVNNYFQKMREDFNVGSIYTQPRKQCIVKSFDSLRNNHILFIQLDQNFGSGGVFVDFFGKKAATAKGPLVFALRTQAPIVPMFICRGPDNTQRMIIEPEAEILQGKDADETIQLNAARLTKLIEHYIRQHPAEWAWIHRRWKARPQEERQPSLKAVSGQAEEF